MKKLFKSVKYLALACALSVGMAGTAVLFAACDDSSESQDSTNSSAQVDRIELSDFEVLINETYSLGVTAENAVWSSSDTSVATVENGIVTGIKEGSVTITVTVDGETATCIATVKKSSSVPVLFVESNDWTLKLGDEVTLDPALKVSDKIVATTFTYESSATDIVEVDANGKLTAKALGSATISVSWETLGYADTSIVTVKVVDNIIMDINKTAVVLVEERLTDSSTNVTEDMVAVRSIKVNGVAQTVENIVWETNDDAVATVENGVITAVGAGQTVVTASWTNGTASVVANIQVTVQKEYTYTVQHWAKSMNGAYTLNEETVSSDIAGTTVSADVKTLNGYEFLDSISKTSGVINADNPLALNLYYNATNIVWKTPDTMNTGGMLGVRWSQKEMTGVPESDVRPGTYYWDMSGVNYSTMRFSYSEENVGGYMILNVYFTKLEKFSFQAWPATNDVWAKVLQGVYDSNFNETTPKTGKWLMIAIKLDEEAFPKDGAGGGLAAGAYSFDIALHWDSYVNDYYMGDYCFVTAEQFEEAIANPGPIIPDAPEEERTPFEIISDANSWGSHVHGQFVGLEVVGENAVKVLGVAGDGAPGFMLTKSAIEELIDGGVKKIGFDVTTSVYQLSPAAGYVCVYSSGIDAKKYHLNKEGVIFDGSDAFFASGSRVIVDLEKLLAAGITDANGLKFVVCNEGAWATNGVPSYVTLSNFEINPDVAGSDEPDGPATSVKTGFEIMSDANSYMDHFHGRVSSVAATENTVTISTTTVHSAFRGFMLKKSAIDELVNAGYTTMEFKVTTVSPYFCFYSNGVGFIIDESVVAVYDGNDTYFASGTTIKIDLLALQSVATDDVGLKFVATTEAGWTAYEEDLDYIFSDFVFTKA